MRTLHLITKGHYSDKTNLAFVEGEDDPTLDDLKVKFRNEYLPGYLSHWGSIYSSEEVKALHEKAHARLAEEGLINAGDMWDYLENGFINWLVKHHGFTEVKKWHEYDLDFRE